MYDDDSLSLSHKQHVSRGYSVQRGAADAQQKGCTGLSAFAEPHPAGGQVMRTFNYRSFCVLPTIHMLLLGVVADFLAHILQEAGSKGKRAAAAATLAAAQAAAQQADGREADQQDEAAPAAAAHTIGVLTAASKRVMRQRLTHIHVTSDFSSAPKDFTKHLSSLKMEDMLVFVGTTAPTCSAGM